MLYTSGCVIEIELSIRNVKFKSVGSAISKQAKNLADIWHIDFFFCCEFLEIAPHTAGNNDTALRNLIKIGVKVSMDLLCMTCYKKNIRSFSPQGNQGDVTSFRFSRKEVHMENIIQVCLACLELIELAMM